MNFSSNVIESLGAGTAVTTKWHSPNGLKILKCWWNRRTRCALINKMPRGHELVLLGWWTGNTSPAIQSYEVNGSLHCGWEVEIEDYLLVSNMRFQCSASQFGEEYRVDWLKFQRGWNLKGTIYFFKYYGIGIVSIALSVKMIICFSTLHHLLLAVCTAPTLLQDFQKLPFSQNHPQLKVPCNSHQPPTNTLTQPTNQHLLLVEEILHEVGSLSHYLQGFGHHPRWLLGISSINKCRQENEGYQIYWWHFALLQDVAGGVGSELLHPVVPRWSRQLSVRNGRRPR